MLGSRAGQSGLRREGLEGACGGAGSWGCVEGFAEMRSCGTGSGCCTPTCPRGLLEEECHTLEREIPVLQVSCSPAPTPAFLPGVDSHLSHLVCEPVYLCVWVRAYI